uniref:Heat shock protein 70 n=1 Tax=Chaetoceros debilis TaxID=122233 RepID=A0A7S3PTV8_9STRA|mmetsp:Transcript_12147/g.18359  ORF Transcript_12147/g.18359 Transcript_12147/m.18359 type:complete len:136 (+) Transcript_12147:105-512(+)
MVQEAEKFKAEGDAHKNRIEAKNGLENYCYTLKTSISSPEVEGKIPEADKTSLTTAIDETLQWLDSNLTAEEEEFEEKQKALEGIAMPVLQSMGGGAAAPGGMPGGGMPDMGGAIPGEAPPAEDPASGPTIDEID